MKKILFTVAVMIGFVGASFGQSDASKSTLVSIWMMSNSQ